MSCDAEAHAFMRKHNFATLITQGKGGMTAIHLPLLHDSDAGPHGTLLGHFARANPQWKTAEDEALVVFPGPHVYISPTWNYVTVHAYGAMLVVEDRDELHDFLTRTISVYERKMPEPGSYDPADPEIDMMLKAIVGFRIEISRLEGKAKLNQNHLEERRWKVIRALEAQGDEESHDIAKLMEATLKR